MQNAACPQPLSLTKEQTLKKVFGYDSFRPGQAPIVDCLLAGRDVLAVMPTGAGKSVCYQVPALMMPGITLVVSPLVSLMQDQVRSLVAAGVKAAYLNSSLTDNQKALMLRRARDGWYKIIYVAPERLLLPGFLAFAQSQPISMVVVDEAHCISQWGQDFRPSYLQIEQFVAQLPLRPVVTAFTATATARVRQDIRQSLALQSPYEPVAGFDRPNLYFEVRRALPSEKDDELLSILKEESGSGIVYCSTTRQVEETAQLLCERGYAAAPYHGKMEAAARKKNQEDFLYDRVTVMVATNAFGMGIDKPNVRYVVHYNLPKDIESYYQEAGRAGRDGENARCVLLYSGSDVRTIRYFIEKERDDPDSPLSADERAEAAAKAEERLKWMTFYATTERCLRGFILQYFGETPPARCENCSSCYAAKQEQQRAEFLAQAKARRAAQQEARTRRRIADLAPQPQTEADEQLLAALFALRKRLAAKKKLPAYLIFGDATLREMAARRPQSRDDLLAVKGVGEAKADRYGAAFLAVVREFCEE